MRITFDGMMDRVITFPSGATEIQVADIIREAFKQELREASPKDYALYSNNIARMAREISEYIAKTDSHVHGLSALAMELITKRPGMSVQSSLAHEIVEVMGKRNRIRKFAEECAEVIHAAMKLELARDIQSGAVPNVYDVDPDAHVMACEKSLRHEIIDLQVLIDQVQVILGMDEEESRRGRINCGLQLVKSLRERAAASSAPQEVAPE